jgi:hypothetical protein
MQKYALLCALCLFGNSALADDATAQITAQAARDSFAKRTAFAKDETVIDDAIASVETAITQAVSNDLKYDLLLLESQILVWKGSHSTKQKAVDIYDLATKKADAARNLDNKAYAKYADAQIEFSIAFGKWALEKGVTTVLARKDEMTGALDAAFKLKTASGDLGIEYDHYAYDRVYGRMFLELPNFAGGDKKLGLKHEQDAVASAPEHSLNHVYLAQAQNANGDTKGACETLKNLLAQDPLTMIPDRAQDAVEDFADAKTKQKEYKCKP